MTRFDRRRAVRRAVLALAPVVALWQATPLLAQTPAPPPAAAPPGQMPTILNPNDKQPIEIQADSGIEWQQNAKVYIARGNAVAIRGDTEVHADTLVAHYRDAKRGNAGGNTEIYRLDADGHVLIKKGGETVVGDNAVYDVDQGVGVVTGQHLKLTTATDTVTARDRFDWYDQRQIAVARGDAVATRDGKTIRADVLTAYLAKASPAETAKARGRPAAAPGKPGAPGGDVDSKLSRIDATGHVVVTNGPDVGQADYGVYNSKTAVMTLIGNVVITRGRDVIRGQYAVMDLNNNISRMMPAASARPGQPHRVTGLFVRSGSENPAPAPAPAPGGSRR
ncbi:MAG TPA: LptA/OstA family protein [Stellaceae bacterium]|nr:LptA/OstA family protein [Stellaceae bacterium]